MRPRAEALRTRSALGQGSYRCPGAGATGRTKDRPWVTGGQRGRRTARAGSPAGRHHCPHFPDASGQRGALTRARPPDPDHALPTPPCADRTSGALRRSQGAEAGSLGDTGGRGWSRQEAGGGGGLGRCPQMCLSLCLRSRLGGAWLPRYGRSHDHGRGGAGPVPGRALRAGGGASRLGVGGPTHHRDHPSPQHFQRRCWHPPSRTGEEALSRMTTAGHCHEDHSAPPKQRGEQREPQMPARAGPAVGPTEGWGPDTSHTGEHPAPGARRDQTSCGLERGPRSGSKAAPACPETEGLSRAPPARSRSGEAPALPEPPGSHVRGRDKAGAGRPAPGPPPALAPVAPGACWARAPLLRGRVPPRPLPASSVGPQGARNHSAESRAAINGQIRSTLLDRDQTQSHQCA